MTMENSVKEAERKLKQCFFFYLAALRTKILVITANFE